MVKPSSNLQHTTYMKRVTKIRIQNGVTIPKFTTNNVEFQTKQNGEHISKSTTHNAEKSQTIQT